MMFFVTGFTLLLMHIVLSPAWACPKHCNCDGSKLKCRIPAARCFPQFNAASNTTVLDLSDNNLVDISAISLKGFPLLEELILDGNKIYFLGNGVFKNIPQLRKLSLKENNIHYIEDKVFCELPHLEELYLSKNQISKFPNLKNNTKLTSFCISYNKIDELPSGALSANERLSELKIKANQISSLQRNAFPTDLSNYVTLNIVDNRILTLPPVVKDMTGLENLFLCRNPLKSFKPGEFSKLKKLKVLSMYDVGLAQFAPHVFNITSLEELYVGSNEIEGRSLSNLNLPNLKIFHLVHNKVKTDLNGYSFSGIPNLVELDLSHSQTKMTPNIFALVHLKKLILEDNRFSEPPLLVQNVVLDVLNLNGNSMEGSDFSGFRTKQLELSNNSMTSLDVRDADNLVSVTSLDLSHNMLDHIPDVVMMSMPNVQTLNVSYNALTNLTARNFQNFFNLTTLSLKGNNISSISKNVFANLTNLKNLFICQNQLKELEGDWLSSLPYLKVLTADGNLINEIKQNTFKHNPKLKRISLNNNQLGRIDGKAFENLKQLEVLKLLHNSLTKPPKLYSKSLRILGLCFNPLGNLPAHAFRGFNELQVVLLRNTRLLELPRNVFGNTGQIRYLNLIGNNLTAVPSAINQMPLLRTLKLSENPIRKVDPSNFLGLNNLRDVYLNEMLVQSLDFTELFSLLPALRTLHTGMNPWHCGCKMQQFALGERGSKLDVNILDLDQMICSSPAYLDGKKIEYLQFRDFRYCESSLVKSIESTSVVMSLPALTMIESVDYDVYNQVSYVPMGGTSEEILKIDSSKREVRIDDLSPDTQYFVCVQTTSSKKKYVDELFLDERQTCHKLKTIGKKQPGTLEESAVSEEKRQETSQNLIILYSVLGGALAFVILVTVIASSVWCRRSHLEQKGRNFVDISSISDDVCSGQMGIKTPNGKEDGFDKGHINLACDVIGQSARTKL